MAQILKRATRQPAPPREPRVETIITPVASPPPRVEPYKPATTPTPYHMPLPSPSPKAANTNNTLKSHRQHMYTKSLRRLPIAHNKALSRLRPTQSRLNRLVNQALSRHTGFQAQSVVEQPQPPQWACPVFHADTGVKQSLDMLLDGRDSATWTRSLTNELGRLA